MPRPHIETQHESEVFLERESEVNHPQPAYITTPLVRVSAVLVEHCHS